MPPTVDDEAIECEMARGTAKVAHVKEKEELLTISVLVHKPILRHGTRYAIWDGEVAYMYEEGSVEHRPIDLT